MATVESKRVSAEGAQLVNELRCKASVSTGENLSLLVRPEGSGRRGAFRCEEHGAYHTYSIDFFSLLITSIVGAEKSDLNNYLSSQMGTTCKADRKLYIEEQQRVLREDRLARQRGLIEDFGVAPELLDEYYSCYRKIAHSSLAHAKQHVLNLLDTDTSRTDGLDIYRCSHCTGWHVGHRSRGDGEREVLARREKAIQLLRRARPEALEFYAEKGISNFSR